MSNAKRKLKELIMNSIPKPLEYNTSRTVEIDVFVKYDDGGLMVWRDGDMCDDVDYSEYEERLKDGEDFETLCEELIEEVIGD